MKWLLPAIAVLLAGVIAWPFLFGSGTVDVKGKSFSVEHRTADDGSMSRYTPTRNRPALAPGEAILCSWDRDRYLYFWSDGSKAEFDIAYLDAGGKVLQTGRLRPPSGRDYLDEPGVASEAEARRALLVPAGTFESVGLSAGDTVGLSNDLAGAKPEPMSAIKVGDRSIRVTVSPTLRDRSRGLMHRPRMSKDEGMLFMYPRNQSDPLLDFYMRNTLMPLDIAYFNAEGKLVNVVSAERAANPATQGAAIKAPAAGPAQFVLEMPIRWFRENGLTDDQGKPVKDVSMELTDALRKRAGKADSR